VHDWAGRVVSETDARGNMTTHTFDLAGNLAGIAYPDGRTVARVFDGRGLTVSQTDTTAVGVSSVTQFAYDETGAQIGQERPSGVTTQIDRDLSGRVTSIEYTGLGVTGNPLPSGVVNPSSAAPGNAYGHCKANGNGHPNQQPAGCSTGSLTFAYAYDERGLISQRDVISDEVTTRTSYVHDDLGRLSRSVTGGAATIYVWDAASNLVGEGGTDDPSTTKVGDAYAIARTVNAANELVTLVKNPVGTPGGKVATTQFTYDARGNRTGAVTTTVTGNKTHVESTSTFVYDSMDHLTSTTGLEGSASFVRDGVGRALTVTEDGVTSNRLYDGFTVVADGATQIATAPNGQVLSETTTTTTTKGKVSTTSVASVDVLTDVLGSAVATASAGVISADLQLFGDFGDLLTTRKPATSATDTVTGFTGKLDTAGLVEFATRTYDPETRVWVQDDRYRGTTTRAASMNRYAYVEGAPESFVDELGFYRARAAIQAQRLAALNAELQSALAGLEGLYGAAVKWGQDLSVAQMLKIWNSLNAGLDPAVKAALDPIVRQLAYDVTQVHYQQKVQVALEEKARREEEARAVARALELQRIEAQYQAAQRSSPWKWCNGGSFV
jgi:RHS repeat-associated protein